MLEPSSRGYWTSPHCWEIRITLAMPDKGRPQQTLLTWSHRCLDDGAHVNPHRTRLKEDYIFSFARSLLFLIPSSDLLISRAICEIVCSF